jgi:hypothetical protein
MRALVLLGAVATIFAVGGCNDEGLAPEDMAVAPMPDMSMAPKPDLRMNQTPLGCAGVVQCLMGGNAQDCLARATPTATMLLNDMLLCGVRACVDTDAGAGDCLDDDDQSQGCLQCAIGVLMGGAQCQTEVGACLNDT